MTVWTTSRDLLNIPRDRRLLNVGLLTFVVVVGVISGERIGSGHHTSLLLAASGAILLALALIKPGLLLPIILFFLIIPFTLGVYRLSLILEIANLLIVLLFVGWIARKIVSRESLCKSPLNAPVIAYLLLVLLSYFRNLRPPADPTNLPHVWAALSIMIYVTTSHIIRRKYHIYAIKHCFFVFLNVGFLITLYIAFTGAQLPFMVSMGFFNRTGGTPLVTGGGVVGVGSFGTICILFLLSQPSYIRVRWIRYFLLVVYLAAIPLSGSRGVLLALFGSLVFLFLIQRRFKYVAALMAAAILTWIYVPDYYDSLPLVIQRIVTFTPSSPKYGGTIQTRLSMWVTSLKLWLEAPLFGIGYGWIDPFRLPFDLSVSLTTFSRGVHNGYIFILRNTGLLGAALFGWMALTFFKQAIRLRERIQEPSIRQFVLFLIAYAVFVLIGIGGGGGVDKPRLYFIFGLISAIYGINMSYPSRQ